MRVAFDIGNEVESGRNEHKEFLNMYRTACAKGGLKVLRSYSDIFYNGGNVTRQQIFWEWGVQLFGDRKASQGRESSIVH